MCPVPVGIRSRVFHVKKKIVNKQIKIAPGEVGLKEKFSQYSLFRYGFRF